MGRDRNIARMQRTFWKEKGRETPDIKEVSFAFELHGAEGFDLLWKRGRRGDGHGLMEPLFFVSMRDSSMGFGEKKKRMITRREGKARELVFIPLHVLRSGIEDS
jgi:hypothetical protein